MPATPFLGRETEVAELRDLLTRDDVRLVTLTGPGGTGKTRLALQAAAEAAEAYPAGVFWAALAALRDPALVLESAARALGASGDLAEHIGDRRLLLLLDNFEHLIAAADGLAPLLERCPNLTLLVTSRESLHLAAEHEWSVDPLRRSDAVELFLTRAMAVKHDFAANAEVAAICERLDDLPLAIELAAARVKLLSPAAILERLEQRLPLLTAATRDAPERQRTLRATIEWSHELLTADEQRLFARLGVFRGGWTIEAAESVAEADLDGLQSLVDKSLVRVRPESGRFWMLETIREYAVERFEATDDADALRGRHAEHFLALAEEAHPFLMRDDHAWVDRLEADGDNLRAALDRFESTADTDRMARLAGALWRWWYLHSREREGRQRIESALAAEPRPTAARLRLLLGSSVMALGVGEMTLGVDRAEQARELAIQLDDAWGIAYATMMIGNSVGESQDDDRDLRLALERLVEAAARFDEIGDRHYGLIAHHNQAWILGELGETSTEQQLHEQDLETARELGNAAIEADALSQLGMFARDDGRFDLATDLLRQAIRIDNDRGAAGHVMTHVSRIASVFARADERPTAAMMVAAVESLTAELGGRLSWWNQRRQVETLELLRSSGFDGDELEAALREGRSMTLEQVVALALGPSAA